MKYIIEESVSTTYFHEVEADNEEEAKKKFYARNDVNYNIDTPCYGNNVHIEVFTEKEWRV